MFQSGYSTNTKSVPTYGRRNKAVVRIHRDFDSPAPIRPKVSTVAPASPAPAQPALARLMGSPGFAHKTKSPFGSPMRRPSALAEKHTFSGGEAKVARMAKLSKLGKGGGKDVVVEVTVEKDALKAPAVPAVRRTSARSAKSSAASTSSTLPPSASLESVKLPAAAARPQPKQMSVLPSPPTSRECTPAPELNDDSIIILEAPSFDSPPRSSTHATLPTPSPELAAVADDADDPAVLDGLGNLSLSAVSPLDQLLAACRQADPIPFDDFLRSPALLPASAAAPARSLPRFTKVGEATYSEVFSVQPRARGGKKGPAADHQVVMKVIPLVDGGFDVSLHEDDDDEYVPEYSIPEDVAREINMGRLVGGLDGFLALNDAVVVQGCYPNALLDEWDSYKEAHPTKCQSARPAVFGSQQLYAILLLPYGGEDLESYVFPKLTGWAEAAAVFFSVAKALAEAEAKLQFEHRDLHLGQILVKSTGAEPAADGPFDQASGLDCAIIDFGLSRVRAPGGDVWWTAFEDEHFEGQGAQADVYRELQALMGEDLTRWEAYTPRTNLLWLAYLAQALKPTPRAPAKARSREVEAHAALKATLSALEGADGDRWAGAQDVVEWARGQSWCS